MLSVHHLHAWDPWRSGEGIGSRATGAAGGYEPHVSVETKARSSTEQQVLLHGALSPSHQPFQKFISSQPSNLNLDSRLSSLRAEDVGHQLI